MADRLSRLSGAAQDLLNDLACLGATADVATLALVHGQSEAVLQTVLAEAVDAGLIVRQGDAYSFLHDRIQQAAYSLIPEDRRPAVHLRIGRMLLGSLAADDLSEQLFDVVGQFNRGADQLAERDERVRAATLNLRAGRKVKASAAYASATTYLVAGATLLGRDGWESQYELLFQLQLERAECEFLLSNCEAAEHLIDDLIEHAASKPDLAAAYRLKISLHVMRSENPEGVEEAALECLRLFGIEMPPHPTRERVDAEYEKVWSNLGERPIESLIDLPLMTDPEMQAAMEVLSVLSSPAQFTDLNLFRLHLCHMVNLSMKHGATDASAQAFSRFGTTLGSISHRYTDGYRFGKLACDLVEKHEFTAYRARAYFAMEMSALWTQPITVALDYIREAFRAGVEAGELSIACYACNHAVADLLARGDTLDAVWRESERGLEFARKAKYRGVIDVIESQQRFIQAMRGRTASLSTFSDANFDETAFEAQLIGNQAPTGLGWYWIFKLQSRFISGDYEAAIAAARKTKALIWASDAHIQLLDYYYYAALAVAAIYETASADEQTEWRDLLSTHQEQLREWADTYPPTFGDKYALVSAEIARLEGRDADAMRLYEQAIQSAREHGFVQHEALAYEVAARFYAARGLETIAQAYLRVARRCYLRWGAEGKVRQLEQLHPHLREAPIPLSAAVTGGLAIARLDVETVVKASQALSSEIRLGELIRELMRITLEHAGAERGLLILHRGGDKIGAVAATGHEGIEVSVRELDLAETDLPLSVLHYVVRTREGVVLDDASAPNPYREDSYVQRNEARSILCLPIGAQVNPVGVLYLENNLTPYAFTPDRVAVLKMLASQAAISLENARLYSDLQQENSDRERVEEELRRSEAYLQASQALGRMASFVLDPSSGRTLASPELYRIVGRDPGAEISILDILREYIHPEDRQSIDERRTAAVVGKAPWAYAYRIVLPDGSIKFIESVADPVFDQEGGLVEYVGAIIDVTDRKLAEQKLRNAEEALRLAQADLAHASRVNTMGELTAALAHEINQPITATVANANACLRFLAAETPDLEEAREAVSAIVGAGKRAAEIVSRTRELFRKGVPKRELVDIDNVIRETVTLLESEAMRCGIPIQTRLSSDLPQVTADRIQLQQVIMNLVMNSLDAMKDVDGVRALIVSSRRTGDGEIAVAVSDTGSGLPARGADRIFDTFFTTKVDGTGMGLSISRSIVEAHGGRLWAEPNLPRGTILEFSLPVAG